MSGGGHDPSTLPLWWESPRMAPIRLASNLLPIRRAWAGGMEGEMTVQEIVEQVAEIRRKFHGDDEAHHAREDSLHQSVLEAIAKGVAEDPHRS